MFFGVGSNAFQQLAAKVKVRHLTTAETQSDFHFISVFQELIDVAHLHFIVIRIRVWTELDLFDLDDLLLFARFGFALLRLVFEFAEIHDLTHGRVGVRRDFDKVETSLFGHLHGARWRYNADVFAICANQANFVRADIFIDARAGVTLRRCVMGSASDDDRPLIVDLPISQSRRPKRLLQVENHALVRLLCAFSPCTCVFGCAFGPQWCAKPSWAAPHW